MAFEIIIHRFQNSELDYFFYIRVSYSHRPPYHGKVDLDGRPRDVGVYEGSTIINYSKMGLYWGGVEFFSYPQSGCTLFTEYTPTHIDSLLKRDPAFLF